MKKYNNKITGDYGETIAAKIVIENGFTILERNFRCRFGEIDIIALDKDTIVFIEVKTRRGKRYGEAEEAVDYRKQKKIRQIAEYYLLKYHSHSKRCRFDVYSIYLDGDSPEEIRVLENCF